MVFVFSVLSLVTVSASIQNTTDKDDADGSIIIRKDKGSITFVVDENLPAPEQKFFAMDGDMLAERILDKIHITSDDQSIYGYSFGNEKLYNVGEDVFYKCMVLAYADHRPVTISPDMMWLLIAQGFSRYVNAHPEEMRGRLVTHEGKLTLIVRTNNSLLSGNVDWDTVFNSFSSEISHNTAGEVAEIMTADFTTTTTAERIASQVTLMDAVKSYFDYMMIYMSCGIPNVTLTGTPADWKRLKEKTRQLGMLGLEDWTSSLMPILEQFERTAKGKPSQSFWKNMVKRNRVDALRGGGCSSEKPTELDGWFLKFFPDENGSTRETATRETDMPSEIVRVGIQYKEFEPATGIMTEELPLEIIAGFVGVSEDTLTHGLTPRIGWLVRKDNTEEVMLDQLKEHNVSGVIDIRVKEVPELLRQIPHIKKLVLRFDGDIVLPEWMNEIIIDKFFVFGEIEDNGKVSLIQRFPGIKINPDFMEVFTE